jgi:hypothetical protein
MFGELGFLGFAFDPLWPLQPYVYARYVREAPEGPAPFRNVVSRFRVDPVTLIAVPESEAVLIETAQPGSGHGGGAIAFEGSDNLFISLGDANEREQAQDTGSLLGSVLRINVRGTGLPLDCAEGVGTIPPGNPLLDGAGGACDEIWAYGFRNPWRLSYDPSASALWVADVGQSAWEEVNVVNAGGGNYGWPIMEGPECSESDCDQTGLIHPRYAYTHSDGLSITGGFVYTRPGPLQGRYVFGDWHHGHVWALRASGADLIATLPPIELASFGVDNDGELYAVMLANGIARMDVASTSTAPPMELPALGLSIVGPHPFSSNGELAVTVPGGGPARMTLYDTLGRRLAVLLDGVLEPGVERYVSVHTGDIAPGVYVVWLVTDEGQRSLRLTVSRP